MDPLVLYGTGGSTSDYRRRNLCVSTWFEATRPEYYARLLGTTAAGANGAKGWPERKTVLRCEYGRRSDVREPGSWRDR